MGVNIFEEHCSGECNEADNQMCEQMFPHLIKQKKSLVKQYEIPFHVKSEPAGGLHHTKSDASDPARD